MPCHQGWSSYLAGAMPVAEMHIFRNGTYMVTLAVPLALVTTM